MKGMGSYTPFEIGLSTYSIDEINEMYLSGKLDRMYEEFERKHVVPVKAKRSKKTRVKGEKIA